MQLVTQRADTLLGRPALVVGNGESRIGMDLGAVRRGIVRFGCNALYRDCAPDYLGAVDLRMVEEIAQTSANPRSTLVLTRPGLARWRMLRADTPPILVAEPPDDPTTGPMMVHTAAVLGCDPILLLGFDLTWTPQHGRLNNVYRGTRGYAASSDAPAGDVASRSREQLAATFQRFGTRRFRQIGPATLPVPQADWEDLVR